MLAAGRELSDIDRVADFRVAVTGLLAGLVACTRAGWNDVDLVRGSSETVLTSPLDLWPGAGADLVAHLDEHPLYRVFHDGDDWSAHAISELVSPEVFHATALYRDVYRRVGIEDQLGAPIADPDRHVQLTLDRDEWGFSHRDRTVLDLFRSLVAARYDLLMARDRLERLLSLREAAASPDAVGVVVVRPPDRIVDATPAARDILARWSPDCHDRLPPVVARWYAGTMRAGRPPVAPLRVERSEGTLVVRQVSGHPGVLAVLDRARTAPGTGRSWGLSPRQVEVLVMVAAGAANAQIAQRLGISRRTVEKHLQQAYELLGVGSRTAAAALVRRLDLAGGAGWDPGPEVGAG